jgi:putative transcriptional regulator
LAYSLLVKVIVETDELFEELIASVREGGAILRGEVPPARAFVVEGPDVLGIRNRFQLSQREFAALLGISVATLRNWEQGRRKPEGPARILLQVVARHPDVVWEVVRAAGTEDTTAALSREAVGSRSGLPH